MKIPKIIENICQTENVEIVEPIRIQPELSQYIIIGIYESQKVIVKIFSVSDKEKANRANKEKIVTDLLLRNNEIVGRYNISKSLKIGQNEEYFWVIREYLEGKPLGGIGGSYDKLTTEFLDDAENIISQIVNEIKAIQNFPLAELPRDIADARRFEMPNEELIGLLESKLDINLKDQVSYFNNFRHIYYEEQNLKFSFGDLNPANVIIDSKGKANLTDFEQACVDNYMSDFAYLWIFFQQSRELQDLLIKKIIKNETDKNCFRSSIIKQVTNFGWHEKDQVFLRDIKNHPSIKYLIAAGESFDAIMNVKAEEK